jgi:uncharacterized protein
VEHVKQGTLPLKNPRDYADELPYAVPKPIRVREDQVSARDLDAWLEAHREWKVEYRFQASRTQPQVAAVTEKRLSVGIQQEKALINKIREFDIDPLNFPINPKGRYGRPKPRRLINLARERTVTLCTSLTLIAELAEVIGRDKFAKRVRAAALSATELVQDYERLAEIVEPQPLPAPASRDADDDHVLTCALAAQPDLIVSGDRDLLALGAYQGIPILSTADALAQVAESGG